MAEGLEAPESKTKIICYTYILECADRSYYTGSTKDLELRLGQHQNGEGANHTRKHLPVKLVYVAIFDRIDYAFNREKQIQGWRRTKKQALINGEQNRLPELSIAYRESLREPQAPDENEKSGGWPSSTSGSIENENTGG